MQALHTIPRSHPVLVAIELVVAELQASSSSESFVAVNLTLMKLLRQAFERLRAAGERLDQSSFDLAFLQRLAYDPSRPMDAPVRAALQDYLHRLPGFDPDLACQSDDTRQHHVHHVFLVMQRVRRLQCAGAH